MRTFILIFFAIATFLNQGYSQTIIWNWNGYESYSGGGDFTNIKGSGIDLSIAGLVEDQSWFLYHEWSEKYDSMITHTTIRTGINDFSFGKTHQYSFTFSKPVDLTFLILDINKGIGWYDELVFSGNPQFSDVSRVFVSDNHIYPTGFYGLGNWDNGTIRVSYRNIRNFKITHGNDSTYSPGYIIFSEFIVSRTKFSNNSIVVYPNPADNYIIAEWVGDIQKVKILDKLGKEINFFKIANNQSRIKIDVSSLASAIYTLQFYDNNGNLQSEKVIVCH